MSLRTVAAVWADLETNGLGLPSRLMDPFKGEILLLRVLRRAAGIPGLERICVLCPVRDVARLKGLALPERAELLPTDAPDVAHRAWMRRARKWAVDGWRGGIAGTTAFDEEAPPKALWEACRRAKADCLLRLPSHAPFLDPRINADLLELHLKRRNTFQFTFCQAPPGLAGEAYHPEFLETMAKGDFTPRHVLMIRKDQEGMDPQRNECHLDAGERVRNAPYRFSCESARLWRLCESLSDADAPALVEQLDRNPDLWRGARPREILADIPALDPDAWKAWLGRLAPAGDTTVTLGVREDPLAHPHWQEFLGGAYGVNLRTPGALLDEAASEALMSPCVDVVTLTREDAAERLLAAQKRIGTSAPLVALEYALDPESEGGLPDWWKRWFGRVDWPYVTGGKHAPLPLLPPNRRPCLKLSRLLFVRGDGAVLPCAEEGVEPLGRVGEDPAEIWSRKVLWESHRVGAYPGACGPCREWGRV